MKVEPKYHGLLRVQVDKLGSRHKGGRHDSCAASMHFLPPPRSLHDAATMVVVHGGDYTNAIKELVDHLIRDLTAKGARKGDVVLPIDAAVFCDEAEHLAGLRLLQRVHLAGLAEYMANLSAQPAPGWCERPEFFLLEPFVVGGAAARERTVAETPAAFRRRLFFTGRALAKLFAFLP